MAFPASASKKFKNSGINYRRLFDPGNVAGVQYFNPDVRDIIGAPFRFLMGTNDVILRSKEKQYRSANLTKMFRIHSLGKSNPRYDSFHHGIKPLAAHLLNSGILTQSP